MTKKPTVVLLVATVLAAVLAACGGSGGSGSSSTTTSASGQGPKSGSGAAAEKTASKEGDRDHGREDDSGGAPSAGGGEGRRHVPVAPLAVSGGGSAQFRVKGGDNSVQDYGEEAGGAELQQAAEATHSLLVAEVRGEWARACSLLAAEEQKRLEQQVAKASRSGGDGCAAALAAFTKPVSGSAAREITQVDAASLRHEGEQAFLIYVGAPEGTVYAMPLRLEGGAWKPTAISGVALPGVPAR